MFSNSIVIRTFLLISVLLLSGHDSIERLEYPVSVFGNFIRTLESPGYLKYASSQKSKKNIAFSSLKNKSTNNLINYIVYLLNVSSHKDLLIYYICDLK